MYVCDGAVLVMAAHNDQCVSVDAWVYNTVVMAVRLAPARAGAIGARQVDTRVTETIDHRQKKYC